MNRLVKPAGSKVDFELFCAGGQRDQRLRDRACESHEKVVVEGGLTRGAGPRRRPHRRDHPRGGDRAGGGLRSETAMCARVTLTIDDIDEIAGMLDAELSPEDARRYKRRYNVAPSDRHWILEYGADRRVLVPAKWGYVPTSPSSRGARAQAGHQRARRAGRLRPRVSRGVRVAPLRGRHRRVLRVERAPRTVLVPPRRRRAGAARRACSRARPTPSPIRASPC